MHNYKKLSLTLLALLVAPAAITIATRGGHSQGNAGVRRTVTVLRRQEQLGQPPTAQELAAAQDGPQPAQQEREFEDKIPKHLPIKVKVKNLEKVKNLNNEKWLRDLEIEVTNTGDKPIYYLGLSIELPEVKGPKGHSIGYPLDYGRLDLSDFRNRAQAEDVPINPGGSYVFRVPENWVKGWEGFKIKEHQPDPRKVQIKFHILHFGDGTGFMTTGGLPVPNSQVSCKGRSKADVVMMTATLAQPGRAPDSSLQLLFPSLPASYLPVIF